MHRYLVDYAIFDDYVINECEKNIDLIFFVLHFQGHRYWVIFPSSLIENDFLEAANIT